jgi:uncharacterized YccA/Bax inhibitor family protein
MTVEGTINRTVILLALLLVSAGFVWSMANTAAMGLSVVGAVAGFILALVIMFKKEWAYICAPIYAVCEGLFIGGISAFFELRYPGVVMQATSLTFGTLFALVIAYRSGYIKVTEKFKAGVFAATMGIALVYLLSFVLGMFGMPLAFINGSGAMGILFSLFVVGLAALNLVLDFDFITTATQQGAPRYMEWYAAFGLMVTLVWLYIELLRLLVKLRGRD